MFVGAIPLPAVEQITRVVSFDEWGDVFVGCSGSFRFERAVKERYPGTRIHSNDISLLSCGLGALATATTFPLAFAGRLAFLEKLIPADGFFDRIAAVLVALEMARFKGENDYAKTHFRHYEENFEGFLNKARQKLANWLDGQDIESFTAGDFRAQVERAVEAGGGIAAFPPPYKGGYERLYRFVDQNTEWPRPDYGIWNPADLEPWLLELGQAGVRYCVVTDHELESLAPVSIYRSEANKPIFCFASDARSSIRRKSYRAEPFAYKIIEPGELGPRAKVRIVPAESEHMTFLKNAYLAKGISHVTGMMNFLVYLDGRLAGGFIFSRDIFGNKDRVYMMSDFVVAHGRKLSKLIAMLSTCRVVIHHVETRLITRVKEIHTTAFTQKSVSMKYRGIFDLAARKPGLLNYSSKVREQSPEKIYREWFRRFAQD